MRIHILFPAILLISSNGLASDVFDIEPDWTYPITGQHNNLLISSVLLNDDSIPDLILGNNAENYIRVFYGEGDGSFVPGEEYVIEWPLWIETADMDNDGDIDAIVRFTPPSPDSFAVFLNDGYGVFSNLIHSAGPGKSLTGSFSVIDFNFDGICDIVTAILPGTVDLLLGNGDGTFNSQMLYDETLDCLALACGDVDNDEDIDIVLLCMITNGSGQVSVLLNNGDGSVSWKGYYGNYWTEGAEASIAIGDLNNDLIPDLVCCPGGCYPPINAVYTLLGEGDGSFLQTGPGWFDLGVTYTQTNINDYNLDGNNDALFSGYNGVLLMLGSGNGLLATDYFNIVNASCWESGLGDFDLDGDVDFVKAIFDNPGPMLMEVYLNKTIQLGIEDEEPTAPVSLCMISNPFSGSANVCLLLAEPSFCVLNAYDIQGRQVSRVFHGVLPKGDHQLTWNSGNLPVGCYTLVLDTHPGHSSMKCVKVE